MIKVFFIAPTALNAGLTSICLGLVRGLDSVGLRVGFLKPISQHHPTDNRKSSSLAKAPFHQLTSPNLIDTTPPDAYHFSQNLDTEDVDRSIHFITSNTNLTPPTPIPLKTAQQLISQNEMGRLMEEVIDKYTTCANGLDVLIVEGLVPDRNEPYTAQLNVQLAKNLNAEVILVTSPMNKTPEELNEHLELSAGLYESPDAPDVVGCILNKISPPNEQPPALAYGQKAKFSHIPVYDFKQKCAVFAQNKFSLIGQIPWNSELTSPRTLDLANLLNAKYINKGDIEKRRVAYISICARTIPNMIDHLAPGTLIVTPGDRDDIIVASCMAAQNGVPLAGLLLTGDIQPAQKTLALCYPSIITGLPIISTSLDTLSTAQRLLEMNNEVPTDDFHRIEKVMMSVIENVDLDWLQQRCTVKRDRRLSPPAFRHQLIQNARKANKTIILPEGNEPRTIKAAVTCHERNISKCILVGDPAIIRHNALTKGIKLPKSLKIINPDLVRQQYVEPMVALRRHKGLTEQMALAQLEDNVVLATMMLALGEVDGLVSGAVHTTANTIRPALQLIKTLPNVSVVSSVFFMCLPEQVLVYGDCAVNPDPNAQELADIAIQSADSAKAFGVMPKVAMISYSTGDSGSGSDVEKVREATRIAKEKRPDLIIDGPLQYDAAAIASVAKSKAPNSPVAGQATVFVFPDLNTGNTTYKAVQRSANVISIGPMLQGLKKPVNDLSRGALVDDITFTIALTAVQAAQLD
jgi:phosphate acetyltransferase